MKTRIQKIVVCSMVASLACVATMIIKIPSPLNGYINLGDCIVLMSGWLLSPFYAFIAAGVGSALADVLSGYVVYAPATFVIKGLMAIIAYYGFISFSKKLKKLYSRVISGVLAEIIMVSGYLLFESVLYDFLPSVANIPANAIQGVAGLVLGIILIKVFEKQKLIKY